LKGISALSDASVDSRNGIRDEIAGQVAIAGIAGDTDVVTTNMFDLIGMKLTWNAKDIDTASYSAYSEVVVDKLDVNPGQYGSSSLQYYSTLLEVDNLSLGCCDFSNETKFTENNGLEYTEFNFSMEMETFPVDIDATLKWDNDPYTTESGKTVSLTPSLSTDWACLTVYTDMGTDDDSEGVLEDLTVEGFEISAELGHVKVTSLTALNTDYGVYSLDSSYHYFDEVLSIEKLESAGDLDFTLDIYTNLFDDSYVGTEAPFAYGEGSGLAPAAIEGSASYPISSQFDLGTNLAWAGGLKEVGLTFDYSF